MTGGYEVARYFLRQKLPKKFLIDDCERFYHDIHSIRLGLNAACGTFLRVREFKLDGEPDHSDF